MPRAGAEWIGAEWIGARVTRAAVRRLAFAALALAAATGLGACGASEPDLESKARPVRLNTRGMIVGVDVNLSPEIEVVYDEGTVGTVFFAEATTAGMEGEILVVSRIVGPDGNLLFSYPNPVDARPALRPFVIFGGKSHLGFPQSDRPLARGTYKLQLAGFTDSAMVRTVRRLGGSNPVAGRIDLNLFFVVGSGLTSRDFVGGKDAKDRPPMEEALGELFSILAVAGLSRGEVAAYDIRSDGFLAVDPMDWSRDSTFRNLLNRANTARNKRAVNLFFVRSLGGGVLGIAAGIPGSVTMSGTTSAGVILSVAAHGGGTRGFWMELGNTMAHEVGHLLGLYHTSEYEPGSQHDLMDDTPECPAAADRGEHPNILTPEECADFDADNLMFWTGFGNRKLSPGQASVLLRSPVVREK